MYIKGKKSVLFHCRYLFFSVLFYFFSLFAWAQSADYQNTETAYFEGLRLMDSKNLSSARKSFENYLTNTEGLYLAEAQYYRAYCALVLYHKDGEKLIEDFVNENPVHPKTSTAFFELGKVFYKSRNYPKTVDYLLKSDFTKLTSADREEAVFMLGYSYFSLRKFNSAIPYFNQLKSGTGAYSEPSSYYAGYIEYETESYREAVNDFTRAENSNAYAKEVPYMKTAALFKLEQYDEVIRYGSSKLNADQRYSGEQEIYLLVAESYFLDQQYENAETFYSNYSQMVRGRIEPDVLYRIGYSQYALGKYEEAQENLKKVAGGKDEVAVYASYYLGVLYQKSNNTRYAITAFDKVRNNRYSEELKIEAEYQYAKLSYDLGNHTQAINSMKTFIANYPDNEKTTELNELLSEAYLLTSDYQKAIKHIDSQKNKSKKLLSAYQKANYLLGTIYFNKGDYRRAVDLFDTALEYPYEREWTINSYYWSAEAYSVGKRFDDAQTRYLKLINDYANDNNINVIKARYGLGYTYYNSEKYSLAEKMFYEFVKSNPGVSARVMSDAHVRLADCHYVRKDYQSAIEYYQKALRINPADADYVYLQLGMINALQEKKVAAVGFFDRVIAQGATSPYYEDALFQRAQLAFNQTEYQQSIQFYTRLIKSKPSSRYVPFSLIRRASAYYNLGQKNQAISDYEKIFEEHIQHPIAREALIPIQELLVNAGRSDDYDKFLAMYKEANPDEKGLETIEFETSRNQYFNQNYRKAISGLVYFVDNYPVDPRVEEATYYVGDSYYRLQVYDSAELWLSKIENSTSFWQFPKVIDRLASISMRNNDFEKATKYYKTVEQLTSNKRQQNEARIGLMEAYFMEGEYDSSIVYAKKILNSGPTNVNDENKASLFLGKSYFEKGNYELAKDEFLNTTNNAKDIFGAEAQFLLGQIFYNTSEYKNSINVLIDLNEKYGAFQNWVGKGFLLIADNYVGLDDYFQAKGTLNSLIEYFPEEDIKEKARNKLVAIEKKEQQAESAAIDTVETTIKKDSINNGN